MSPWQLTERNLDGVQHEALRKRVELPYHEVLDELDVAFYDFWRVGKSRVVQGYDVQGSVKASAILHAQLCNYLYLCIVIELYGEAQKLLPGDEVRVHLEDDYKIWSPASLDPGTGVVVGYKQDVAAEGIAVLEFAGISLVVGGGV